MNDIFWRNRKNHVTLREYTSMDSISTSHFFLFINSVDLFFSHMDCDE